MGKIYQDLDAHDVIDILVKEGFTEKGAKTLYDWYRERDFDTEIHNIGTEWSEMESLDDIREYYSDSIDIDVNGDDLILELKAVTQVIETSHPSWLIANY